MLPVNEQRLNLDVFLKYFTCSIFLSVLPTWRKYKVENSLNCGVVFISDIPGSVVWILLVFSAYWELLMLLKLINL